jgi:hypothetical protein
MADGTNVHLDEDSGRQPTPGRDGDENLASAASSTPLSEDKHYPVIIRPEIVERLSPPAAPKNEEDR